MGTGGEETRSLEAALPWLYLKSVSSGEMGESLKVMVVQEAKAKLKRS